MTIEGECQRHANVAKADYGYVGFFVSQRFDSRHGVRLRHVTGSTGIWWSVHTLGK